MQLFWPRRCQRLMFVVIHFVGFQISLGKLTMMLWDFGSSFLRIMQLGTNLWTILGISIGSECISRKRPRRVLSKKALSLNIVIKHCLESSAEVMAVLKDCHQRLPKVLLK